MRYYDDKEAKFHSCGRIVHLHTPSLETDVIFHNKEDYCVAMAHVALASAQPGVEILAYALMSNHFHFILRGTEEQAFYEGFKRRFSTYLSRNGRPGLIKDMTAGVTAITSLKQFRDEIAYVIRNPFVVRNDVHPFAFPWTSGFLYFNPFLKELKTASLDGMSIKKKQEISKSRDTAFPPGLTLLGQCPNPADFVNYSFVESLFDSARQFIFWTMKNVESQVETALRLGETPSFSDEDLLPLYLKLCHRLFGSSKVSDLSESQKMEVARKLKFDYYASNGQIARLSRLPLSTVNALFPLSAKEK